MSSGNTTQPFATHDGAVPFAALLDVKGTLYGTTESGGDASVFGGGTVFSITTSGTERVLHRFGKGSDGFDPQAALINVNGTLYGTTIQGGKYDAGTVFSITTSGTEHVLHSFGNGSDGNTPEAALIDVNGTLYGTTFGGGAAACLTCGTVFSITPSGTERVLHTFGNGSDGAGPQAALIDVKGTLYGTTSEGGGKHGDGTVFSITPSGTERVLYNFSGSDGDAPEAALINVKGTLYGTTYGGGAHRGVGTVFSITTSGKERVLYSFGGYSTDGAIPRAALIDVKGTLYGTTYYGGAYGVGSYENYMGTVFSITTSGTERVLHSFGSGTDGANPVAALIEVNGTLYGTTYYGGTTGNGGNSGGTVFSITRSGKERVLHSFGG